MAAIYGESYTSAVSVTRPNNTSPDYSAGDCVGATAAAWTFPRVGPAQRDFLITTVSLEIDLAAVPSGMTSFRLYLYNVTPPSAYADNAAWDLASGDRASFLGYVDLGTPVDLGSTLYVQTTGVNYQVQAMPNANANMYGYLITNGGYTPAANTVYKITLQTAGF